MCALVSASVIEPCENRVKIGTLEQEIAVAGRVVQAVLVLRGVLCERVRA